jgi:hypothetical protein
MTDEKTIEPEDAEADAALLVTHSANGLDIQVQGREGVTLNNPALHFANWLGQNSQRLWLESRDDYNQHLRGSAAKLLKPAAPRLVSHTGERLN